MMGERRIMKLKEDLAKLRERRMELEKKLVDLCSNGSNTTSISSVNAKIGARDENQAQKCKSSQSKKATSSKFQPRMTTKTALKE